MVTQSFKYKKFITKPSLLYNIGVDAVVDRAVASLRHIQRQFFTIVGHFLSHFGFMMFCKQGNMSFQANYTGVLSFLKLKSR